MSLASDDEIISGHLNAYGMTESELMPGERDRVIQIYRRFHTDAKKFELKITEAAIIVIDMQNHFVDPKGGSWCPQALRQIPSIKKLLSGCRKLEIPIIFTQTHFGDDCVNIFPKRAEMIRKERQLYEGTWSADIYPELKPLDNDRILKTKHTPDSFVGTDLDFILRDMGIRTLIICGTNTDICCETTARTAFCLHYNVVMGSDVCSTYYGQSHDASLAVMRFGFCRVMSSDQILEELKASMT